MTRVLRVRVSRMPGAEDLPLPAYESADAAGLDLRAAVTEPLELAPGARVLVPTGLRIALPPGHEGQIRPRSGLALRHGLVLPNAPGTIDPDYRGEVQVLLWNAGEAPFRIERGDRIAQLVVARFERVALEESDRLGDTERGDGGFGSTGHERSREETV